MSITKKVVNAKIMELKATMESVFEGEKLNEIVLELQELSEYFAKRYAVKYQFHVLIEVENSLLIKWKKFDLAELYIIYGKAIDRQENEISRHKKL